ncbi:unnamed protein product [Darwinula stevensoni]|uniref:Uncharacterized protein n=1 Tax=Darwinula stevensoni TaxID=69355 RepID=A0A7R8XAC0_9CRUS|nr:unnamed protein product [Darwinula stevensoni]CAG0890124.1 unnamed protein product [Darwinula stevensoni]
MAKNKRKDNPIYHVAGKQKTLKKKGKPSKVMGNLKRINSGQHIIDKLDSELKNVKKDLLQSGAQAPPVKSMDIHIGKVNREKVSNSDVDDLADQMNAPMEIQKYRSS